MEELRLLDMKQLAQMFKISRSHAYRLKQEQQWPHVLLGTQIRFTLDDVRAIQEMNHKPAKDAPRGPRIGTGATKRPRIPKRTDR
ncbi:helix-turn-helix domain-containing protein [Arthrobacter sp. NyZ413]|uniref:helix-turn-helix domain-containing protein n=1 Tax=Arthrobacter sp. NyZ413 TaxID=3144669 RepID=UPI003BF90D31